MTRTQLTLGIIKPTVAAAPGPVQEIMRHIKASGLEIARSKKLFWKESDAEQFYAEHRGRFYFPRLVQAAASGQFVALAIHGQDAIKRWRAMIGPTHVYKAQWTHPDTLRAKFGLSDTRNGFHGSDSPESARKELAQIFEGWDIDWWLAQQKENQ
ncbi:hypothetical protein ACM66B_004146 [Microbotryomycetes sp. NB124-2]